MATCAGSSLGSSFFDTWTCRLGLNRSALVTATALTYAGMTGEQALARLRERRPGALFNGTFAVHVHGLPARRIRVDSRQE